MANAREVALRALIEYRRRGAWPDLWLKKALEGLSSQDAGLTTALVNGVVQRRMLLDFYIGHLSAMRLAKITPQVLDILRLGAYQLLYMDGLPDYAVVSESVNQAKKHANPRAAGFVNGLMRALVRQREALPQPQTGDAIEDMSIALSFPRWLVEAMRARLGEADCRAFLQSCNMPAPVTARVNTARISTDALLTRLSGRGVAAERHPFLPDALSLPSAAGLMHGPELGDGLLYIMGAASQLSVHALGPRPGGRMLDLCAAPGGKTLMSAQLMEGRGSLVAMDIHPHKARLLEENAQIFGFGAMVQAVAADASVARPALLDSADYVLCDVPCSGLGIMGRKPDIRYKDPAALAGLPALQGEIAGRGIEYLKPGGVLVYSTCTVLEAENEAVVARLLTRYPQMERVPFDLPGVGRVADGMLTLWPHVHGTEGFFICKMRKRLEL